MLNIVLMVVFYHMIVICKTLKAKTHKRKVGEIKINIGKLNNAYFH